MQFVAHNVAKVELDSTSATVVHNTARKIVASVQALICVFVCVNDTQVLLSCQS